MASAVFLAACGGGGGASPTGAGGGTTVVDTGASPGAGSAGGAATVGGATGGTTGAGGSGGSTDGGTYTGPGTTAGSTSGDTAGAGAAPGGSGGTGTGTDGGPGAGASTGASSAGTGTGGGTTGSGTSAGGGSGAGSGSGSTAGSGTGTGAGSGTGTSAGPGSGAGTSAGSGATGGSGAGTSTGSGAGTADGSGAGAGTGTSGVGDASGGAGTGTAGSGTGDSGVAGGSTGGGAGSGGTGVGDGTGVAGTGSGTGSGGTGVDGSPGSGGTGVSAVGIGSVDGFGSIIVNDTYWNIDNASVVIVDDTELRLGMSVQVAGRISTDLTRGTATRVVSAAELRGRASAPNAAVGSFEVMGIKVLTDVGTVFDGLAGVAGINNSTNVQVYGLPTASGELLATRVERRTGTVTPIVTGAITQLNTAARTFRLGAVTVAYANAGFGDGVLQSTLANGQIVRVRANQDAADGVLAATTVQSWYAASASVNGLRLSLSGLVTDFRNQSDFRVLGVSVSGAQTNVSGGPANRLADGVRVEVSGTMTNGVLVLDKLRLRSRVPEAAPTQITVSGNIAQFTSLADFKIQGQTIDATSPTLRVANGTAAQISRGRRVSVTGTRVVDGVLRAETLTFLD